MNSWDILIEINGKQHQIGSIRGNDATDAMFQYDRNYLQREQAAPISIGLPLTETPIEPSRTRTFFEGLLPEGFTRRSVAGWLHLDENDYLAILGALGQECLGAIKVVGQQSHSVRASYEQLSIEQVKELAKEGARKSAELVTKSHLSLTGASGKVGLYYQEGDWFMPCGDAPSTHIVKQSHVRLDSIVLNEQLCMMTAGKMGIPVPESFIVNVGTGQEDEVLFASKRYDRILDDTCEELFHIKKPKRLHQEDFSQALGIPSQYKYERKGEQYLSRMFELLRKCSANPIEDSLKLWDQVVFDFLVGNTDNHIKNHSLLYAPDLQSVRLAPAYDMLSTCIYESSTKDMAFHVGGVYAIDEMDRICFQRAASWCGIGEKIAMKHFDALANCFEATLKEAAECLAAEGMEYARTLQKRIVECGGYRRL